MNKKELRNKLTQENFDYYIFNGEHLSENNLLYRLYRAGYTRSEAKRAVNFIYNQTIKAFNA